ncbi:hypothetical protein Efla_004523 [Eimeria flavescens]
MQTDANRHRQTQTQADTGVCFVDVLRFEFLCSACSAGKPQVKKVGSDRLSTFEVQKLVAKFHSSGSREAAGGPSRPHHRSSSSARAAERRRRQEGRRAHSKRRENRDSLSPSSQDLDSADSSPRAAWASEPRGGRHKGSSSSSSSSRRKGAAAAAALPDDFAAAGVWPAQSNSSVPWGSSSIKGYGGGPPAPLLASQQPGGPPLPGMGGLAGMGMASAAAVPGAPPQQQQPGNMWLQPQQQQGLMLQSPLQPLQQQQLHQQHLQQGAPGGPLSPFADQQQQWRGPGGMMQPQQMMPRLQQQLQHNAAPMYGMQQGALQQQQPQQQPVFGIPGGPMAGRQPQMMFHQQQQPSPMLQQMKPQQQLQQQQQRNPFASMRGPSQQVAPAARPSNPFASMQGAPPTSYGTMPFQQQPFQQPQALQQQPLGLQQQLCSRPPHGGPLQQQAPFGMAAVGPPAAAAAATNPFASAGGQQKVIALLLHLPLCRVGRRCWRRGFFAAPHGLQLVHLVRASVFDRLWGAPKRGPPQGPPLLAEEGPKGARQQTRPWPTSAFAAPCTRARTGILTAAAAAAAQPAARFLFGASPADAGNASSSNSSNSSAPYFHFVVPRFAAAKSAAADAARPLQQDPYPTGDVLLLLQHALRLSFCLSLSLISFNLPPRLLGLPVALTVLLAAAAARLLLQQQQARSSNFTLALEKEKATGEGMQSSCAIQELCLRCCFLIAERACARFHLAS